MLRATLLRAVACVFIATTCALPVHDLSGRTALLQKVSVKPQRSLFTTNSNKHADSEKRPAPLNLRGGLERLVVVQEKASEVGSIFWPVVTCMLYFTSVSVTLPAMPSMANKIANADGSVKVSPEGVSLRGTLSSIDLAFTMLTTKLWGTMSDRYGRKPLMMMASGGLSLGWLTVLHGAATSNLEILYAGRALDGITSCMQPLCQSAVKDVSPQHKLQGNFGVLQGAALGGSLIIGGIVGGYLTKTKGPEFVLQVAAGIAAVNVVVTGFFAPETLPPQNRHSSVTWDQANPFAALTALHKDGVTLAVTGVMLLALAALNGLQTNFFSYIELRYGWDRARAAVLLSLVGVVISFSQYLGAKLLAPRLGVAPTIKLALSLQAGACAVMALTPSPYLFSAAVLLFSAGSLSLPLLTSIVASRASTQESGSVMAALDTVTMLQKVVTHKGMAMLFALGMRHQAPGAFFLVCAGCCGVAVLLFQSVEHETYATERA